MICVREEEKTTMQMSSGKSPKEKEWRRLEKKENAYLSKKLEKKDSRLNQLLQNKVPEKLQGTLNAAFAKAFSLIFEKGTGIIEKTYNRDEMQKSYQIDEYTANVRQNHKSLKVFSKKAGNAGKINMLMSGVSGVGLGVLGIGLPDIALFTGMMLKGIYEIALRYGFDYEEDKEKQFILLLIQGAVAYGRDFQVIDEQLNEYIKQDYFIDAQDTETLISKAAQGLSTELLYMKFLQGIPVVGAVGGAYDAIYMKQVMEYAELKYRRRFLWKI